MHDLTAEQVIDWAMSYASADELEQTAKALYALYSQSRTPEQARKAKQQRKAFKRRRYA